MSEIGEKWEQIKEAVCKEYDLTSVSFSTWIAPLKFHDVKDNTVIIIIPSDKSGSLTYITNKYKDYFKVTISEMMNHEYDVEFKLEKDIENNNSDSKENNSKVYNINSLNANLNPKYKFDTFVVGGNNQMAHAASLAVAESPGTVYNPLFIYGGAGLGKTHLMHAIGHFILETNPSMKVLYVTSEQFTNDVVDSVRSGSASSTTKLREKYRTVDVLMVDDVQFIIGRDATQEEFFNTFNALHSSGKQIVLSSDKPPQKMETLEERFRSRFSWGLIADIQPPDYETRMAILMKNAEIYGKKFDHEIIEYVATNIVSNIRELEGAFNKIIAYAKLNKVELTLQSAEEALKDVIYPDKKKEISPKNIIDMVAEHYNLKSDDLLSKKRNAEVIIPRQVAMYLCREMTDLSLNEIGSYLGKKDHTTIMHGIDTIKTKRQENEELDQTIEIIKSKLSP